MSGIPDEAIEQVRDAADIVQLVGEHVSLRRTGADYRGPCPFHGGKHRNLAVIPKKQMFYCFVCHEGGDVFTFFMKHLGLDYPHAVREVASRVGITIPERSTGGPDPNEPLFSAVAVAADWYARRLREAPDAGLARDYLAGRGYEADSLAPLGLGYAPRGTEFLEAMANFGIGEDVLLEAGLAVRREDGTARPRFWGRLLFPIHDLRGRVVGFGGRVLGDGEPKYLNSPDSRIFHKGRLLYNLHNAKNAIRRAGRAVAVEGYFDVLRPVDAGVEHVVAALGTAFTAEQAALLKRYTDEVVLLYDSDQAGLRASFRAADELLQVGMRTLIASLPPGEDPDSLVVQGGREALETVLRDAIDVFERKLQILERKGMLATLAGRRRALDKLLPTIRAVKDPVTRDLYIRWAAETVGTGAASVAREVDSGSRVSSPVHAPEPARDDSEPEVRPRGQVYSQPEAYLIRAMLHQPDLRSRLAEQLPELVLPFEPERGLIEFLAGLPPSVTGQEALTHVGGEERALLAELFAMPWTGIDVDATVLGSIKQLLRRPLDTETSELKRQINLAPEQDKVELVERLRDEVRKRSALDPRWKVIR